MSLSTKHDVESTKRLNSKNGGSGRSLGSTKSMKSTVLVKKVPMKWWDVISEILLDNEHYTRSPVH